MKVNLHKTEIYILDPIFVGFYFFPLFFFSFFFFLFSCSENGRIGWDGEWVSGLQGDRDLWVNAWKFFMCMNILVCFLSVIFFNFLYKIISIFSPLTLRVTRNQNFVIYIQIGHHYFLTTITNSYLWGFWQILFYIFSHVSSD